jgi:hypothetical protein
MANQSPSKNVKSLEQKVQELILKKLFIKVNEDELIISKVDLIVLILRDLITLAKSNFDIETALKLTLEENADYRKNPNIKRNELKQWAIEFKIEIDAYRSYQTSVADNRPEAIILSEVHSTLNTEPALLDRKLREIIYESLSEKITDAQTGPMGIDKRELISKYCDYVTLIAESDSIDQAVDKLMISMKLSPEDRIRRQESLKEGMMRIASFAGDEIDAVELAVTLRDKNVEYYKILVKVKEELGFDA